MAAGVPPPPSTRTSAYVYGPAELAYISAKAKALGLDPQAVLAVAATEGGSLPAAVGDNGTSFGPWQLHAGGALPADIWAKGATYSRQWADSPAGIDYALNGINKVAHGLRGQQAVSSIVSGFERPANPEAEIERAISIYNSGGGPRTTGSSVTSDISGAAGAVTGAVGGVVGDITHPFKTIEDAFTFLTSWRFAEVLGGFILIVVGLFLLGKQFGLAPPPGVAAAAAMV